MRLDEEQVVVGAAGDDLIVAAGEPRGHGAGICQHLPLVGRELGLQRLEQRHRLRGDDMHERPALRAREDQRIELLAISSFSRARIRPPRGPRSVLWVVVVTTSACGIGLG